MYTHPGRQRAALSGRHVSRVPRARVVAQVVGLGLALGLVTACSTTKPAPPPPPLIYPGARLLYSDGRENVIVICTRGDRIFLSSQGGVAVSPGACGPDGLP